MNKHEPETGSVNPLLIACILLGVFVVIAGGAFFWAFSNYVDQRDNTAQKVDVAVTAAKEQQAADDEKKYLEEAKQPYSKLVGPSDLGSVSISYPKTWSVYIAKSSTDGYEAYLNPATVPQVSGTQPFATRIVITSQAYDTVVNSYQGLVKKGDLVATPVTVNNFNGMRLDGKFSTTRAGSAVIFKVRDKTLVVASDVKDFKSDFDDIIVKSLDFNP